MLQFPCEFPIKVMGLADENFALVVFDIVAKHCEHLAQHNLTTRPSRKGKYAAITVSIQAQSQQQLDAIYQDLTDNPQVMMAL